MNIQNTLIPIGNQKLAMVTMEGETLILEFENGRTARIVPTINVTKNGIKPELEVYCGYIS